MSNNLHIGIDPGTKTGIAIIRNGDYIEMGTTSILKALDRVKYLNAIKDNAIPKVILYVENPNLRKFFGNTGREVLQGAGSIKRDFAIWKEFSKQYGIEMVEIAPQFVGSSFDNQNIFQSATGWQAKESKHARDAAKIIYSFYKKVR
jgi:hypothetical protein